MGYENHPSTQITWRITPFACLTEETLYSDIFTVGGTKWKLKLYPKGISTEHLAVYLVVADFETLPFGWSREAMICLTLVNQLNRSLSKEKKFDGWRSFSSGHDSWGYPEVIPLSELEDISRGFLVDKTVVLDAKVEVGSVHPPVIITSALHVAPNVVVASTEGFDTYFASLEEFITDDNTSSIIQVNSNSEKNLHLTSKIPSSEDVDQAMQSLKDCLSAPFKLNMKERLAKALLTLSLAQDGLSSDQQKAVILFWANFDDFTYDFLVFEQNNFVCELQKLLKDKSSMAMKKNHKRHLSIKRSHTELCNEEEELKKRLKDLYSKKSNLMAEWESLMADSKTLQSNHKIHEKKVTEAEEKKRTAEERMARATTAWANLKSQFG